MQNYSSFPQGLESIWFVPLLHWKSHTEIRNGPCSPLTMSPGHQRQKILQEENLLCLAGSLPPFPVERTIKTTQWFLSLSTEKHQAALVQQYMLEPHRAPCRTAGLGCCVPSPEATLCTQRRCLVQAKASSKPEYFCSLCMYCCVGWVWPGNQPASIFNRCCRQTFGYLGALPHAQSYKWQWNHRKSLPTSPPVPGVRLCLRADQEAVTLAEAPLHGQRLWRNYEVSWASMNWSE